MQASNHSMSVVQSVISDSWSLARLWKGVYQQGALALMNQFICLILEK